MKTTEMLPNPADDWALVELHRWQYGHLPGEKGTDINCEPLYIPIAMEKMADALLRGDSKGDRPDPFNCAQVLIYSAKQLKSLQKQVLEKHLK